MSKSINVAGLPKAGPYSHAVIFGDLVFVSGQVGDVKDPSFEGQFNGAMSRIKKVLEESGSSIEKVLKVTVYLSDRSDFQKMNELFGKHFSKNQPARTTLVTEFVLPEAFVEIDVIASK
ncbi:MAG: RidA family protein [Conexivisphaerales archaeon]